MTAVQELQERKKERAAAVRVDLDQRLGLELTRLIAKVEPASDDQVAELSAHFNALMKAKQMPQTQFMLFQAMDANQSGHIDYPEFSTMCRVELNYDGPEQTLQSLWRALDRDDSGFVTEGEFCKFWRRGRQRWIQYQKDLKVHRREETKRQYFLEQKEKKKQYYQEKASEAALVAVSIEAKAAEIEAEHQARLHQLVRPHALRIGGGGAAAAYSSSGSSERNC